MKVVYICYFSICENLVQNQVVPYLRELAKQDYNITLLTYEPKLYDQQFKHILDEQLKILYGHNISLKFLKYHKQPTHLATIIDIIAGVVLIFKLHQQASIRLLHARSHIPMIIALILKIFIRCKVLFDVRGLLADEYVEANVWKKSSLTYYILKKVEQLGFKNSDSLVVLTHKMQHYLESSFNISPSKIHVIPCCVSKNRAMSRGSKKNILPSNSVFDQINFIYAGSVSGLYLTEEIINFFEIISQTFPNATLTILTAKGMHEYVHSLFRFKTDLESRCTVIEASPANVLHHMMRASVGLSFRKPTFSQIAASPTKIPEYLNAGIPVISNQGIGDTDQILQKYKVGVVFDSFTKASYYKTIYLIIDLLRDPALQKRCQSVAVKYFDLQLVGVKQYNSIYKKYN